MAMYTSVIRLLRPHHWLKNILVFAPLVFVQKFLDPHAFLQTFYGFIAFSLLASTVYVVNDIHDRKSDRLHPKKKYRPIASGEVSVIQGCVLALSTGALGLCLGWWLGIHFFGLLLLYLVANVLYSQWLKHQPILDLIIVSSFYLIRIFAGGVLASIPISELLILTTFFLAFFAVTIKRRQELVHGKESRKVLAAYTREFLDILAIVTAISAITFYALFTLTKHSLFIWSIFFVVYALLRYVYLVFVLGKGEEPERIVLRDPGIVAAILGWALYMFYLLYKI